MFMSRQRAAKTAPLALLARGLGLSLLLLWAFAALALTFPALSGRIVDQANILDAATKASLEAKLSALESKSGIQLVVATVQSLEGQEIEPYANDLFRQWKLGQLHKDNGVLLLVAPNEKRVRIEVGYGLEGTLTDVLSKVVIANAIAPRFKAGNVNEGVSRGVEDIITILTTDSADWQAKQPSLRLNDGQPGGNVMAWLIAALIFFGIVMSIISSGFRSVLFQILLQIALSSGNRRGGSSSSSGGGGFSGGGGSSGGGGASGSW